MKTLSAKEKAILDNFKALPDDAAVGLNCAALVSDLSDRTWRDSPPIETFHITAHKRGVNVGKLRKLLRGELTPCAANYCHQDRNRDSRAIVPGPSDHVE